MRTSTSAPLIGVVFAALAMQGSAEGFQATPPPPKSADAILVICHPSVAGTRIPRAVLLQIYLGTVLRWGKDGGPIAAADLPVKSEPRKKFLTDVLRLSGQGRMDLWKRQQLSRSEGHGTKLVDDDAQMVAFVAATAGAIGYVTAKAELTGVRTLIVE